MYKIINALIDIVTGFRISSGLTAILQMDHWSREQIVADQESKFKKLSEIASRSTYYRPFRGRKLEEYPVLKRDILKENYDSIRTNIRKPYAVHHTSGSTSSPISFMLSREMLLAKRLSHQKMLHWFGLTREAPELKIGGVHTSLFTTIYYLLKNKRYVNSFQVSRERSAKLISKYNRFKPQILYGYPSSINHLICFAEANGITLHSPRLIVTHAENLYKEMAENIQATFPEANIVNQYWASEANIGVSCPEGRVHIDEDTVICEVINEDERGVGDLLVTNLYSFDFPLIRYQVGDRVKLSGEECPCGRKSRVIEHIEGRVIDYIDLPDGRQIPVTSIYLSQFSENIVSYQLIYYKKEALWEFLYIPLDEALPIQEDDIREHVNANYGLSVKFTKIDEIKYTKGGKFKKMIVMD